MREFEMELDTYYIRELIDQGESLICEFKSDRTCLSDKDLIANRTNPFTCDK